MGYCHHFVSVVCTNFTCLFYFHEPLNQMELNLTEMLLRWSSILCILVLLFGSSTWHLVASANYTVWLLKFQICSQKLHMWYKICYLLYPPLPEGGGGYTVLPLSVRPSKKIFGTFFSATIDGRNLIFGHKLHIGMPYRGKRFWNHQIPTSCLPT